MKELKSILNKNDLDLEESLKYQDNRIENDNLENINNQSLNNLEILDNKINNLINMGREHLIDLIHKQNKVNQSLIIILIIKGYR